MAEAHEIVIRVVVEQAAAAAPAPTDGFTEIKEVAGKEYTPSQKMRFALLRRYNKLDKHPIPFEAWYNEQMLRIIASIDKG